MSRNFNAYSRKSLTIAGGVPVWAENPSRYIAGGMIKNADLDQDEVLAAGSPVEFDVEKKEAKILKCYPVKAVDTGGGTGTETYIITLYDLPGIPKPKVGEFVMVAPSTIAGTGKAVAVTTLDLSVAGEITFTVLQAGIDAVAEGAFLCQSSAAAAGSSKSLYCKPNSLTIEDTVVADFNTVGIARGPKYIFKNTMPPAPAVVLNNIPMLELDFFNELQESGYDD